ncbi:hypothetical protein ElyMa_001159300 [Elysia marginata]|uniref:Uncharacterized protein n=1 Tax=Elysia marginata TaxID=1093978 RepID=A0AAV4I1K0_9GAST|nr:hypothetical protein ElyMa_001159300 [Elysia marginata]
MQASTPTTLSLKEETMHWRPSATNCSVPMICAERCDVTESVDLVLLAIMDCLGQGGGDLRTPLTQHYIYCPAAAVLSASADL